MKDKQPTVSVVHTYVFWIQLDIFTHFIVKRPISIFTHHLNVQESTLTLVNYLVKQYFAVSLNCR